VIPVVAIVRQVLAKRPLKLHARNREIFCVGTALGCVMALMFYVAAVPASQVNSGHSSSPRKQLRIAIPDEGHADRPSVTQQALAAESAWFDTAHHWTVKRPRVVIAIFVYKARSVPNRAPPFC
jgi:hypothetical protein